MENERNPYGRVAVLVPCYNEEATVAKVVADFTAALPGARVYVYDNASTDRTAELARAAGATVVYEPRRGKGAVVRSMLRDIDADCYLMVDGDDTYPADAAPAVVAPVLDGSADMVVGDRISCGAYASQNRRACHGFGNALVAGLVRLIYGDGPADVMTGYRAFSWAFAKTFPVQSDGFQIETEVTIHAVDRRWRIESVDVAYRDRPAGSVSKLDTVSDGVRVVGAVASMFRDYRPLAFFGIASALLLGAGLGSGLPVVAEFARTGLVERLPTALLAVGLVLLSALALSTGFILDRAARAERRAFEMEVSRALAAHRSSEGLSRRLTVVDGAGADASRARSAAARLTSASQPQGAAASGSGNSSRGR